MNANAYEERWNTTIFDKVAIQDWAKNQHSILDNKIKTAEEAEKSSFCGQEGFE